MNFANNWSREITLEAGATSAALDLPDGSYRLTCCDSAAATRWEVLGAEVVGGSATLTRGLEQTADQGWPAGSLIYCSVTAGLLDQLFAQLADLQQRLAALEGGGTENALTDESGNTLVDDQGNTLTGA